MVEACQGPNPWEAWVCSHSRKFLPEFFFSLSRKPRALPGKWEQKKEFPALNTVAPDTRGRDALSPRWAQKLVSKGPSQARFKETENAEHPQEVSQRKKQGSQKNKKIIQEMGKASTEARQPCKRNLKRALPGHP